MSTRTPFRAHLQHYKRPPPHSSASPDLGIAVIAFVVQDSGPLQITSRVYSVATAALLASETQQLPVARANRATKLPLPLRWPPAAHGTGDVYVRVTTAEGVPLQFCAPLRPECRTRAVMGAGVQGPLWDRHEL